jgi:ectoine hydroxylase-related dioxygenase (phytanoyl-CoA dioxygenase family)
MLRRHFAAATLEAWRTAFTPLLEKHVEAEADTANRGAQRFYVTLPFEPPFDDAAIYADPDILALCRLLVGPDLAMCQLATDTPLLGSETQAVHRDALPLFPELDAETPPYQLAVNFPLVDVTSDNGPTEIAAGTHAAPKDAGTARLARGDVSLEPVLMRLGDVMVRDVRGLHRGTPNRTAQPRPMVVIGYSRAWLRRPEVSVRIPHSTWEALSDDLRFLLRVNPVVPDDRLEPPNEAYRTFAY